MKAADNFVCVFIECNWGKANTDLSDRYGIGGYPTVLFCNSEGKPLAKLGGREPDDVAKQMQEAFARLSGQPAAPAEAPKAVNGVSVAKAFTEGRRLHRPVLIVFYDESPGSMSIHAALTDDYLRDTLARFVIGLSQYRKGAEEAARFDVTRSPTIVVLNPALEKPEEKPIAKIEGSRSARELKRDLDSALLLSGGDGATAPAGAGASTPDPGEKLSDDEIERRFIKARISAALELYKRGKKDKAIETLEDIIKSYPKHVETITAKKLLEELRK